DLALPGESLDVGDLGTFSGTTILADAESSANSNHIVVESAGSGANNVTVGRGAFTVSGLPGQQGTQSLLSAQNAASKVHLLAEGLSAQDDIRFVLDGGQATVNGLDNLGGGTVIFDGGRSGGAAAPANTITLNDDADASLSMTDLGDGSSAFQDRS